MKSAEFQRGYDAGYKKALLDALSQRHSDAVVRREKSEFGHAKIGGPNSRFKPRGIPGSIYNTPEDEKAFYNIAPFGAVD